MSMRMMDDDDGAAPRRSLGDEEDAADDDSVDRLSSDSTRLSGSGSGSAAPKKPKKRSTSRSRLSTSATSATSSTATTTKRKSSAAATGVGGGGSDDADDSPRSTATAASRRRTASALLATTVAGKRQGTTVTAVSSGTRPSSYTLPEKIATPGKFRYLKPDEIQSGRLPVYDFAVIANRCARIPSAVASLLCGCCSDHAGAGNEGGSQSREKPGGFRRLCKSNEPTLQESEDEHRRIVDQLCGQGLFVDIIDGGHAKDEMNSEYFILLVRATDEIVNAYVTHFRDNLWMEHGSIVDLEQDLVDRRAPPTPAERVQIVDYIIEQRAKISLTDPWIHDMFPMHDKHLTNQLITKWVASWRWKPSEKDERKVLKSLRHNFGEKVAYYFAFINYYNKSLVPIALLGILMQILRGLIPMEIYMKLLPFWGFGVSVVWSFSFLKSWDRKNAAMQYDWNKKLDVKQIEYPNKLFFGEQRVNSLTGELETVYPAWRRLPKYMCVALFMLLQTVIMLVLVAIWVTIYEILKAKYPESHIFSTQWFLILLEGMVFGIFVDVIQWNIVVTKMGALFTHWENYRTEEQYEKALIRKLFLLDFLNYYTWFFSLAFVFVIPGFGDYLMNTLNHTFFGDALNCCFGPYVDQHGQCIVCPLGDKDATCIQCVGYFTFDRHHVDLSAMFVTPIVVTQSLNIALQVIAPIVVRNRRESARAAADARAQKRVLEAGSMKILGSLDYEGTTSSHFGNKSNARYLEYTPAQVEVLNKKAREILFESEQDTYDPYNDFHALTVQYGFTVMFSILWPPMPAACFLINSLKRRTDGYRLCKTLKRPIPRKANGIGGWRGIFTVYAYVAVIVNVLLICISTGSLEFFDGTCVRDIENQLKKQGKTLDDFIFGPNFGCLHISWRMLIILVLEHVLICGAYLTMTRLPRVPKWISTLMTARERRFKELLRVNEPVLFPGGGGDFDTHRLLSESKSAPVSSSGFVDLGSSTGGMHLHERLTSTSRAGAISIDVHAITPLSEASSLSDVEEPSSNGIRTKARNQLASQWDDE